MRLYNLLSKFSNITEFNSKFAFFKLAKFQVNEKNNISACCNKV